VDFHLAIEERPGYLYTRGTGKNNAANAERLLRESYEACIARGYTSLLLEMSLTGPPLAMSEIFSVIAKRSVTGKTLRKIAYIDNTYRDQDKPRFAETVARNRGVNVRLFDDMQSAERWLAGQ
jgi:hypothetical protein